MLSLPEEKQQPPHRPTAEDLLHQAGFNSVAVAEYGLLDCIEESALRLVALLCVRAVDGLTREVARTGAQRRLREVGFTPTEAERVLSAAMDSGAPGAEGVEWKRFCAAYDWAKGLSE